MKHRILHILTSPHLGGAEQVCLWLCQAQLQRGHDVKLLLLMNGKVSQTAQNMGIPLILADLPDVVSIGKQVFRKRAAESIRKAVTEFKPEFVHSHIPLSNLLCSKVLPKMGVLWLTTVHGSWRQFAYAPATVTKPYLKPYLLLRHALGDYLTTRSAARVVAVSDYVRRELAAVGVSALKIRTVLNGLPAPENLMPYSAAREKFGITDDTIVIGALGYFAPVKGFDILIRAFALLQNKHPNLQLLIAGGDILGDTSVRRSLEQLIARLCPQGNVKLLETLDPKAGFLSALDIYVISSRTEGMPLGLLEAMQHGKACVVSSAGGSSEAARPHKEGLVFQSGNPQDLAAQIETLISKPDLRQTMGQMAQQRALTYLTLSRCADDYDAVYDEIVSAPVS